MLLSYFLKIFKRSNQPSKSVLDYAKVKHQMALLSLRRIQWWISASLKNAIDLLEDEWKHKPIGIASVSSGPFGGTQALVSLQLYGK